MPQRTDHLEAIRHEGNRLFGQEDWIGAVAKYSECIDRAVCKGKSLEGRSENLRNVMKLTHSNRAEALLRLRNFEGALSDAEKALELDPTHAKSLCRQGRAAMELGLYEKSCEAFEAALEQRPDEPSIVENLMSSMICLEQSHTGNYGINSLHLSRSIGNYADYVGPVEIRRVSYGYGRRGLFAKQPVKADSIVLVSNPMALAPDQSCNSSGFLSTAPDILVQLLQRAAAASHRSMAQLYSLASPGKEEMDVPSMELFRPGSEWVPPSASTLEVDVDLIKEIVLLNLYNKTGNDCGASSRNGKDSKDQPTVSTALYILPSFLNHSCAPNCIPESIGNVKFIRAIRDIGLDEELTIRYSGNLFTGLGYRQVRTQKLRFTCRCERCFLEEQLKAVFSQINTQVGVLVPASKGEFAHGRHQSLANGNYPATRKLAILADHVEALIRSVEMKIATYQQGWIRVGFLEAYLAKYQLETICEADASCRIDTLNVIMDAMISVGTPGATMNFAHLLLHEVKSRHSKKSKIFKSTKELVLRVIRTYSRDETGVRVWSVFNSVRPQFDYSTFCVHGARENFLI